MKKLLLIFTILLTMTLLAGCAQKETTPAPRGTPQQVINNENTYVEPEQIPVTVQTTDRITFSEPIPSVGNALVNGVENSITITFRNNMNSSVTLPLTGQAAKYSASECQLPTISATYKGTQVETRVTKIKSGDTFTVTWDCQALDKVPAVGSKFSADLRFEYMPESTGLIRSATGTVESKYQ